MLIRPSGAAVLLNCAVKVMPSEEDAIAVKKRHDSLPDLALEVLHQEGSTLVFPMATSKSVGHFDALRALKRLHKQETGMHGVSMTEYLRYVLRDKDLPSAFKKAVMMLSDAECTPVNTVHGDCNLTNIVDLGEGELRWIDLSIRPEPLFKELDEAKFMFREFRDFGTNPEELLKTTMAHSLFIATHFCRVWTRESTEERTKLEELHREYFTRI
jgi:hypothetical protein